MAPVPDVLPVNRVGNRSLRTARSPACIPTAQSVMTAVANCSALAGGVVGRAFARTEPPRISANSALTDTRLHPRSLARRTANKLASNTNSDAVIANI
jgi:hypothetical protein